MENEFRKALESGRRLFGTHVNLTDYRVCEMLGAIGFDYLWIDMEHIATSFSDMERHLIAAKAAGTPAMVRVRWNDIPDIKRVLEAGPAAIVVPMVNSVEEAQHAIDTCIYPPDGKRGFGPCRAIRYGLDSVQDYIAEGSKQLVRILQVETAAAVEAMEEVAKIPYVDAFLIGPMDLSGSVGELSHTMDGPKTNVLIDMAIAKAHAAGKPIGLSTGSDSPIELAHWMQKGVDFISASTDMWSILNSARNLLADMKNASEKYPRQHWGKEA